MPEGPRPVQRTPSLTCTGVLGPEGKLAGTEVAEGRSWQRAAEDRMREFIKKK